MVVKPWKQARNADASGKWYTLPKSASAGNSSAPATVTVGEAKHYSSSSSSSRSSSSNGSNEGVPKDEDVHYIPGESESSQKLYVHSGGKKSRTGTHNNAMVATALSAAAIANALTQPSHTKRIEEEDRKERSNRHMATALVYKTYRNNWPGAKDEANPHSRLRTGKVSTRK